MLGTLQNSGEVCDTFRRDTLSAAEECLGVRPCRRGRGILDKSLNTMEMSHAARLNGNHVLHRELSCSARPPLRVDKERYVRGIVEQLEGHVAQNDIRPAF